MELEHKRAAQFNVTRLRKSSPQYAARNYGSKLRTARIAVGLRDIGKALHIDAYSYNVLEELIKNGNMERLPEWRYVGNTKSVMYQLTMGLVEAEEKSVSCEHGRLQLIPFVFNLSDNFQRRMQASEKNEVAACLAILSRDLSRALRRPVDLWFQLEMAPKAAKGRPHIQGSIILAEKELKKARKVFHAANGNDVSPGFKNHALRFCIRGRQSVANKNGLLYADINWSLYCAKEGGWTKVLYADQNNSMLTSVVSGTSGIKKSCEGFIRVSSGCSDRKSGLSISQLTK